MRHLQTDADCDGMLVHLVDHPYIDAKLVDNMIERFYDYAESSSSCRATAPSAAIR